MSDIKPSKILESIYDDAYNPWTPDSDVEVADDLHKLLKVLKEYETKHESPKWNGKALDLISHKGDDLYVLSKYKLPGTSRDFFLCLQGEEDSDYFTFVSLCETSYSHCTISHFLPETMEEIAKFPSLREMYNYVQEHGFTLDKELE